MQARIDLLELDWPRAYANCVALYHQARRLGSFGRGAETRQAIDGMMRVVGGAAALQEIYAYIASQSAEEYVMDGLAMGVQERDGVAAWERLADGYVALVAAKNASRAVPSEVDEESIMFGVEYRRFIVSLFREAGGFPLLPVGV